MANERKSLLARLFGYSVTKPENDNERRMTFSDPDNMDGALEVNSGIYGGFYNVVKNLDLDASIDETYLITNYRKIAQEPEFDKAIQDIVNEVFSYDQEVYPVSLNLQDVKIGKEAKKKINEEFERILKLMNFKTDAYDVFKRWYVDGRIYFHKVVDSKNPKKGIVELRPIDPRRIRKIRELIEEGKTESGVSINQRYEEYYLYNPNGLNNKNLAGLKIAKDSICFVNSGIFAKDSKSIISYIHKAIRFFNALRQMENSLVIYRLSRASEKRVFNIEVGDLPTQKAESYIQELIQRHRKKLTFNQETGEVSENTRFATMQEDYWFPKRDGKGTQVDILSGGQNLGDIEDIMYFKNKLYESLNVPVSRLDPTSMFNVGRTSEITRDELRFQKFINKIRKKFSGIFDDILKTQLLLKKIVSEDEWNNIIYPDLRYDFLEDNFFTEIKWAEIYQNRFTVMRDAIEAKEQGFVSKEWIRKNILNISDQDRLEIEKELAKEREEERENGEDGFGDMGGDGNPPPKRDNPFSPKPQNKKPEADEPDDVPDILDG